MNRELERARALLSQGQLEAALPHLDESLRLAPDDVDVLHEKGVTLLRLGRFAEMIECYDRAIAAAPRNGIAYEMRAIAFAQVGRRDDAVADFMKAVDLRPREPGAWANLSNVLKEAGRYVEALNAAERALALDPGFAPAAHAAASALYPLNRYDEALAYLDQANARAPNNPLIQYHRAGVLMDLRRYVEALAAYDQAFALAPNIEDLPGDRLYAKLILADWSNFAAEFEVLSDAIDAGRRVSSPFPLLALPATPAQQLKIATLNSARHILPDAKAPANYAHDKIRVGYFSADFWDHATSHLMAELFEIHDRAAFEIIGFSFGARQHDGMRQRVESAFDQCHDLSGLSDQEAADLARALEIDIAIDLKGYTARSRYGIFVRRAAPVQAQYIGFPGTMGAGFIDYLVADSVIIPPALRQFYSEKIVALPDSYQVNDRQRPIGAPTPTRRELDLPADSFVFCSFNSVYKITPDLFDVWMRLLRGTPGAVLWLMNAGDTATANLRREAEARGVDARRLIFAPPVPAPAHRARHAAADLFLDTFIYGAHTTASDALWTGLPVLTLPGETFASRVGASLVTAIGMPELIASSREEYEAIALRLAANPAELAALKQKLAAQRLTAPLFDTPRFARHVEAAYKEMHARAQAGLTPDHIVVKPL